MTESRVQGEAPVGTSARRSALPLLFACLITIAVVELLTRALVDGIVSQNAADWPYNPAVTRIAGMVASRFLEVLAVLAALSFLFRLTRYGSFADLGLGKEGLRWLPLGLALPVLALVMTAVALYSTGILPVDRLLYPGPWPTALMFASATQAAWIEELGFRGALMQGIERLAGTGMRARVVAILVSGALYAALHFLAPFQLSWAWWIAVGIGGLGFGYAFYATGRSLWLTIGLHWGFDLGVFLLLGLPGESRGWLNARLLGAAPSLSQLGGYMMVIGALFTALVIILLLHKGWAQNAAPDKAV